MILGRLIGWKVGWHIATVALATSERFRSVRPAVANHLWQSTVFALVIAALALVLRRNHARIRHGLWLTASVKFLIPFSLLIAIGHDLSWLRRPANAGSALTFAIEEVTQPFAAPVASTSSRAAAAGASEGEAHVLSAILAAVWLAGFLVIVSMWCSRWKRSAVAMRMATPLHEGRELDALRRVEREHGMPRPLEMRSSANSLEPGVFGILRPVLVWPQGVSQRLDDSHLEAILAHEIRHVRRHDNLTATIQMAVEAIFWFHPVVWWLGARLLEEREIACDEEVLTLGSEREVYAESILKVCEFCVGSPLACVAGVTGADLKKRIVNIMSNRVARELSFGRKLLLGAAAMATIIAPIMFGLMKPRPVLAQSQDDSAATAPSFESVSIKAAPASEGKTMVRIMFSPQSFVANGVTFHTVMKEAYGVQGNQIVGAPEWMKTATYDIAATIATLPTGKVDLEQHTIEYRRRMQALLADRLQLALHPETRQLPSYALVVGENGARLQPAQSQAPGTEARFVKMGGGKRFIGNDQMLGFTAQGISIADLAQQLSRQLGTVVVDNTGLTGRYAVDLQWKTAPNDDLVPGGLLDRRDDEVNEASAAPLITAVREQLGLELRPQNGPVRVMVIDKVEKPVEN